MKAEFKTSMTYIIGYSFSAGALFIMMIDFAADQKYWWSLFSFVSLLVNGYYVRVRLHTVLRDLGEAILWE